jgi:hypothetical protein
MAENIVVFGNFAQNATARTHSNVSMLERRQILRDRVQRHVDHLDALVQTLRKLGVGDAAIDGHVAEIFEQYKAQLLRNIDRI